MADNVTAPGIGAVFAADDISGVLYPRTKVSFGVDGAATDVSASAPLPVAIISGGGGGTVGLTNTELRASPVPVSGTFYQATQPVSLASQPLPTGAATEAGLTTLGVKLDTLHADLAAVTPLYAVINQSATASTDLVAAVAGKSIRLLGFAPVMTGGDNTVTLFSGATAISGPMAFASKGGIALGPSTLGLAVTGVGAALKMTLASATQVGGMLTYELV